MATDDPFDHLERHRQRLDQTAENGARLARSYGSFATRGWGEFQIATCFDFNVTFIEEPSVTSGFSLSEEGPDLASNFFPRAHSFVYRWRQDVRKYYTGAWVAFAVSTVDFQTWGDNGQSGSNVPNYVLHHHLVFEGIALKDIPAYLLDG